MVQVRKKLRTVTFLSREQIDFLDKLGKDALFYEDKKLSRSEILSELVNLLINMRVSIKDVDLTTDTLARELMKVLNNGHCGSRKDEQKMPAS
jgi:hypothetical protein